MQICWLILLVALSVGAVSLQGAATSDRRSAGVTEALDEVKLQALLAAERTAKEYLLATMAAHRVSLDQACSHAAISGLHEAHQWAYWKCIDYLYRCGHSKIKPAYDELQAAQKALRSHDPASSVRFILGKNHYQLALTDIAEQQEALDRVFAKIVQEYARK